MKINRYNNLCAPVNQHIFKAYDIRGIYPSEINEETAYIIGRAFVKFLRKKELKIVVGRDNRLSSPYLFRGLVKGIIEEGAKIIDIGLSTTPMLYFAVAHFNFDAGIQITASHNPAQFNGLKLVREKAIPISEKTGLKTIKELVEEIKIKKNKNGIILKKKIIKDYLDFNLKEFNLAKFKFLKIVIDTANSVSGILVPQLKKILPVKIYSLFEELDGNFPNHSPDPLIEENLKFLEREVKEKKADFGVAFDGDGDRVIFVSEKGDSISADFILSLISKILLKEKKGIKILTDVRSSNIVRETIRENKGRAIISRIGHSFIKERMRREKIFFAGEFSGHYYSKTHYFCECPLFVLLTLLREISKTKKKISELLSEFQKYYHSGEINFKIENKEETINKLEKKYKKGKITKIDGLRVDFLNWWFNIRPSQTEPALRLVIEAKTKKLLEKKKKELISLIK